MFLILSEYFNSLVHYFYFLEAERRLRELESERQRLDRELNRAKDNMFLSDKCMNELKTEIKVGYNSVV